MRGGSCTAVIDGRLTGSLRHRDPSRMTRRTASILAIAATLVLAACSGTLSRPGPDRPDGDRHRGAQVDRGRQERPCRPARDGTASVALPIAGSSGTADRPDRDDRLGRRRLRQQRRQGDLRGPGHAQPRRRGHRRRRQVVHQDDAHRPALPGIGLGGSAPTRPRRAADRQPRRPAAQGGHRLVKGDDVACGSKQCYTVTADLDPPGSLATALGADRRRADRPAGATLKLTVHVEKDLPNHLAGVTADVTSPTPRHRHGRSDRLEVGRAGVDHGAAGRPGEACVLTENDRDRGGAAPDSAPVGAAP